jgi:putative membrane protein
MGENEDSNKKMPVTNVSDHLANERTFLAWIRTSIALMGFGFVVVKFSIFLKQISFVITDRQLLPNKGFSADIGIVLVAFGALIALLGYFRFRYIEKQLLQKNFYPSFRLSLLVTLAILMISGLILWYLIANA